MGGPDINSRIVVPTEEPKQVESVRRILAKDPHFAPDPRTRAEAYIKDKLQPDFGDPVTPGDAGLIASGDRYFRDFAKASIYTDLSGKLDTFVLWGGNRDKYRALGGPTSWLGWPTSNEEDFAENGKVNSFEHGAIYWWDDSGAIELRDVVVRYRGLYCFGETDDDGFFTTADEPMVTLAVVPAMTGREGAFNSQVYGSVDAGDSREDYMEIYRGRPYGMAVGTTLWEVDEGRPDKYLDQVKGVVQGAGHAAAGASAAIPYVGPAVAVALELLLKEYGNDLAALINDVAGTEDDLLDVKSFAITAKNMVTLARAPRANLKGIEWQLETPLMSGDGASYKAYFDVAVA